MPVEQVHRMLAALRAVDEGLDSGGRRWRPGAGSGRRPIRTRREYIRSKAGASSVHRNVSTHNHLGPARHCIVVPTGEIGELNPGASASRSIVALLACILHLEPSRVGFESRFLNSPLPEL